MHNFRNNQDSFDKSLTITLTKKQTKEVKGESGKYRIVMPLKYCFDFLDLYYHQVL